MYVRVRFALLFQIQKNDDAIFGLFSLYVRLGRICLLHIFGVEMVHSALTDISEITV